MNNKGRNYKGLNLANTLNMSSKLLCDKFEIKSLANSVHTSRACIKSSRKGSTFARSPGGFG
jgi:hypothetical protein